jgi:tagatose 6-phosphate kinase
MKPILCIGTTPTAQRSMIFPKLTIDAVNRATEVYEYASGKSLNVARVLKTLGQDPIATGFLGGPRGEFCRKQLDEVGIRHDFVAVAAPTRLCTTVIDSESGTVTELVQESKSVTPEEWSALDAKVESLLPGCVFAIFSGSLPPGAPKFLYSKWLSLCDRAGVHPIVDARGAPLLEAMAHPTARVKVNREEFAATLGKNLSKDEALFTAMEEAMPDGSIVVTDGAAGAYYFEGEFLYIFTPPKIKAVNPVGSGDAFAAGWAAAILAASTVPNALAWATATAASNATSPLAGDVRIEQINELFKSVSFKSRDRWFR